MIIGLVSPGFDSPDVAATWPGHVGDRDQLRRGAGPAIVGIAVLRDSVAAGRGVAAVIGFLMVVSGAAGLVWRTDAGFLSGGGENAGT